MGCRYHTHDHSDEGNIFQAFLYEFFELFHTDNRTNTIRGSLAKLHAMKNGSINLDFLPPTSVGFIHLIDGLLQLCKEHYVVMQPKASASILRHQGDFANPGTPTRAAPSSSQHSEAEPTPPFGLLYDHQRIVSVITQALQITADWSMPDKRDDQYQYPKRQTFTVSSSYGESTRTSASGTYGCSSKRKDRDEDDFKETRNTRQKPSAGTADPGPGVAVGEIVASPDVQ